MKILVLVVEALQSNVSIPDIVNIPQAQVVGYTETILQINIGLTNNIVAEQTSSFTPWLVDKLTARQHCPLIKPFTADPIVKHVEHVVTILPLNSIPTILSSTFD